MKKNEKNIIKGGNPNPPPPLGNIPKYVRTIGKQKSTSSQHQEEKDKEQQPPPLERQPNFSKNTIKNDINKIEPTKNDKIFMSVYNILLSLFFFISFISFFFHGFGSKLINDIKINYLQELIDKYINIEQYNYIKNNVYNDKTNENIKNVDKFLKKYNKITMNNMYIYLFGLFIVIYLFFAVDLFMNYKNKSKIIGIGLTIIFIALCCIFKFIIDKNNNFCNIDSDQLKEINDYLSTSDYEEECPEIENFIDTNENNENNENNCYFKNEKKKNINLIIIFSIFIFLFFGFIFIKKYIYNYINNEHNKSSVSDINFRNKLIYLFLIIIILFSICEILYFMFIIKKKANNTLNKSITNYNYNNFKYNLTKNLKEYELLESSNIIDSILKSFLENKKDKIKKITDKPNETAYMYNIIFNKKQENEENEEDNENSNSTRLYYNYLNDNKYKKIFKILDNINSYTKKNYNFNNIFINNNNLTLILFFLTFMCILLYPCIKLFPNFITVLENDMRNEKKIPINKVSPEPNPEPNPEPDIKLNINNNESLFKKLIDSIRNFFEKHSKVEPEPEPKKNVKSGESGVV